MIEDMESVIQFLIRNGFEKENQNHYIKDVCSVLINDDGYAVTDDKGYTMYSGDLNIYWLIGVLTYFGFISKNYK